MDFRNVPNKMLARPDLASKAKVNLGPLILKLRETEVLARKYQTGTPARLDFAPMIKKLREAQSIGAHLQTKANSGRI